MSQAWSKAQTLTGPVLSIRRVTDSPIPNPPTSSAVTEEISWTHFLPEDLTMEASLQHQQLKRGIYPVQVYRSDVKISGVFRLSPEALQSIGASRREKITVSLGIADLRGIESRVNLSLAGRTLELTSGLDPAVSTQGLTATLPADLLEEVPRQDGMLNLPFSLEIPLKGSESIWFAPMGKMNHVHLTADYPSPKFSGNYLPAERSVLDNGFSAQWEIPDLTRNYPQQMEQADWYAVVAPSVFGVELLDTVSPYRQAQRAVKYALLVIVLTFVVVFFADQKAGNTINIFQYLLSGLALVLFYSLLISLSEVMLFGWAYAVAAALTVALLSSYLYHLLPQKKTALYIGGLLTGIYLFVYLLLQMESYALLAGSLGLFLILAGVMRLSTGSDRT